MQFSYTVRTEPGLDTAQAVTSFHIAHQDEGDTIPVGEEEAVEMARLFAGYIRAAEAFYADSGAEPPAPPSQPVWEPLYREEGDHVRIGRVGNAVVTWHPGTSPAKGSLYFAGDPTFCSSRLEGEQVEGSAEWANDGRTAASPSGPSEP